jgi:hypothetical protein
LYALRDCADQLRRLHGISIYITNRERIGDIYVVTARARDRAGREDESTGAVALGNLKGDALANALMKAETKAKRRVTLSIAGLGWLDETELATIPGAQTDAPDAAHDITGMSHPLPVGVRTPASGPGVVAVCRLINQGLTNAPGEAHDETTLLRKGAAYGTYGRLCTRQHVRPGREFAMGGVTAGRMSGAADLLRYGVGSPRRTPWAGGLLTGVSAWRPAGGLAVRSVGALDGASRDID